MTNHNRASQRYNFVGHMRVTFLYCAVSVLCMISMLSAAPLTQKELAQKVHQDLQDILHAASVPNDISDSAALRISNTVYAIPQETIDAVLVDWVRSSLICHVRMYMDVFTSGREIASRFVDDEVQVDDRAFKTLTESGSYYKNRSAKIADLAREYRVSFHGYLYNKFSSIQKIEFDLPQSPLPSDTVSGIIVAASPALQMENHSIYSTPIDFSNRLESDIFQLSLINYIWLNTATHKLRDDRIYSRDLVSFVLSRDEGLKQARGINYREFREVIPLIDTSFNSCVHIEGNTAKINWAQFKGFLTYVDQLFFEDKPLFALAEDKTEAQKTIIFKTETSRWSLLSKSEDEITTLMLRKDVLLCSDAQDLIKK